MSVLDKFFFENDHLDEPNQMLSSKNFIFPGSLSKTQNGCKNQIYPSLTLLTAKLFPLKRVLKNRPRYFLGWISMITNVLLCAPIADLVKMNIVDLCILIKSFERKKIQDGRHFDHALGFLGGSNPT